MRCFFGAILLAGAESPTLIAARGETSPVTMSESDTRSGRRRPNRAAEKKRRGDSGERSLLISPELTAEKRRKTSPYSREHRQVALRVCQPLSKTSSDKSKGWKIFKR